MNGPGEKPPEATMRRPQNAAADGQIGKRLPVLDRGFACLVDYMGGDDAIVQAARVSYGKGTKSAGDDRGLIRYLMRHRHTTPFEMVELKFLMKLPIFVARQMVRHRTASINEYSARYSIFEDEFYLPELESIRKQSTHNKQGREDPISVGTAEEFRKKVEDLSRQSFEAYQWALNQDVSRELARMVLPVNIYTQWYWKIDLHNFFHFLNLRLDVHAQEETRKFAGALAQIARPVAPVAFEAFDDFVLGSTLLSRTEKRALGRILKGTTIEEASTLEGLALVGPRGPLKSGEGPEFVAKLRAISALMEGS